LAPLSADAPAAALRGFDLPADALESPGKKIEFNSKFLLEKFPYLHLLQHPLPHQNLHQKHHPLHNHLLVHQRLPRKKEILFK
jgi:hypothetical protein